MNQGKESIATPPEQWSALLDGHLSASQAQALVRASLADDSLMLEWRSMCTIGEVLRAQQIPDLKVPAQPEAAPISANVKQTAANDSVFRWRMVAGVAALAAVGSLVWGVLGHQSASELQGSGVLAQGTVSPPVPNAQLVTVSAGQIAGQEALMIRDPRLDELLAAHKQFGGASALHQSTGALRSVAVSVQRP